MRSLPTGQLILGLIHCLRLQSQIEELPRLGDLPGLVFMLRHPEESCAQLCPRRGRSLGTAGEVEDGFAAKVA
jgi:hypothetical protein